MLIQAMGNKGVSLSLFMGCAWSFVRYKTIYSQGAGNVMNIEVILNNDVNLGNYNLSSSSYIYLESSKRENHTSSRFYYLLITNKLTT